MNRKDTAKMLDLLGMKGVDPDHVQIIVENGKEGFESLPDEVKKKMAQMMREKMGEVGTAVIVKDMEDNQMRYTGKETVRSLRAMLTDADHPLSNVVQEVQELVAPEGEDRAPWPTAMMLIAMTLLDRLFEEFGDDGAVIAALTVAHSDFSHTKVHESLGDLMVAELKPDTEGETAH